MTNRVIAILLYVILLLLVLNIFFQLAVITFYPQSPSQMRRAITIGILEGNCLSLGKDWPQICDTCKEYGGRHCDPYAKPPNIFELKRFD